MIALLDTNVIIRFLVSDDGPDYRNLYSFFKALEEGKLRVELKIIVLFQVIFVLKSYYKVPKEDIVKNLLNLLSFKGIRLGEKKIIIRALELWREKNLEIVDCYLIASLEGDSQNLLYSYDHDFDRFDINRKEP